MLKRIYIHGFKCFQNFEWKMDDFSSALFLGKNGSGKSSLINFFEIFKKIGDGELQLINLIKASDFNFMQLNAPMRLEIEIELEGKVLTYKLLMDFPDNFKAARVKEEQLLSNGMPIIDRKDGKVEYYPGFKSIKSKKEKLSFLVDWHMLALPIIESRADFGFEVQLLKSWLSKIIVLSPIPALMLGEANQSILKPDFEAKNIAAWLSGLLSEHPKTYISILDFLKKVLPDLEEIRNKKVSDNASRLSFIFKKDKEECLIFFERLSSGEKIFVLTSLLLANIETDNVSICIWDEPDNYISLLEIQPLIYDLRRAFNNKSQLILTTHNPEVIRSFSTETTFILRRNSHLEPTRLDILSEVYNDKHVDAVDAIKAGLIDL